MSTEDSRRSLQWFDVGALEDVPRLGARVVRTARGDIAVFRTAEDALFALEDRCPHRGGPLSQGIVYNGRVACPLHNWSIDLAGGCAVGPDEGCAATYVVRVQDGRIYLQLDASAGKVVSLVRAAEV